MKSASMIATPVTRPTEKHANANRTFQGIPGIEATARGRLFAVWYAGGVNEGPENYLVAASSRDGGRSWDEPVAVVDPPEEVRAFDPVIWRDPLKRLWLFWAQSHSPADGQINDGVAGVWAACCGDPDAAEPLWSPPVRIADGVMMDKPTVLRNGDWLLPVAVWDAPLCCGVRPPAVEALSGAGVWTSRDQGASFQYTGGLRPAHRSFDEHQIVELRDGTLWMLTRTRYGIAEGFSRDGGRSWSEAAPAALRGPSSRFFIRRLESGRILLVNHDLDPMELPSRRRLTAWLSDDDGRSWRGRLLLDEREAVSYPDGSAEYNGHFWIVYDRERYRGGEILAVKLSEERILEGGTIAPEERVLISRTRPVPSAGE